jgi:hypothetical protein
MANAAKAAMFRERITKLRLYKPDGTGFHARAGAF